MKTLTHPQPLPPPCGRWATSPRPNTKGHRRAHGFTLIEIMVAIGIFAGLMVAIYASWTAIVRSTQIGITAAVESHRTRTALRALEDTFTSAIMFEINLPYYAFLTDTTEDFAAFSLVSRLPSSFPGSGLFPGQPLRRITFSVESSNSVHQLIMRQNPILTPLENGDEPYPLVLAKGVGVFDLAFWDPDLGDWSPEWLFTNQLPAQVKIALGFVNPTTGKQDEDQIIERIIQIPAGLIRAAWQRPAAPAGQP